MSWKFKLILYSQTNTREIRDVCRASNAETHQTRSKPVEAHTENLITRPGQTGACCSGNLCVLLERVQRRVFFFLPFCEVRGLAIIHKFGYMSERKIEFNNPGIFW